MHSCGNDTYKKEDYNDKWEENFILKHDLEIKSEEPKEIKPVLEKKELVAATEPKDPAKAGDVEM